ncbi:MAG TPA: DNA-binding domain-containing protein [Patescibacteria group bacterium]|nr:DNA-binding domain-containing protein [Patescibacteria group bacterium]
MSLPPPGPIELGVLQRWFQSVISHADGVEEGLNAGEAQRLIQLSPADLEKVITRSRALTATERLSIYANAYHTRLLDCLGEVYPMLKRTLGEEGFNSLAFGYLQDYPSRTYTLNELGRHFPQYLEQTKPAEDDSPSAETDPQASVEQRLPGPGWTRFVIDLARLEWAIYEVFDGEGVEGKPLLTSDQVLAVPPDRWAEAKLKPVVCLQIVNTQFPVNDYYTAVRRARPDEPVVLPAAGESFVALTRRNFVVRRYSLSKPKFELLRAIKNGLSVGKALEEMLSSTRLDPDKLLPELQAWFCNWTAEGFFEAVQLD